MVYAAAEVKSSPLEAVIMIVGLLDMAESGACARTHVHAAAKLIMWAGRGPIVKPFDMHSSVFLSDPPWQPPAASPGLIWSAG